MKKLLFNLRALMLLLLMMVGVSSVWAENETITLANGVGSGSGTSYSITWSGTSCDITQTKENSNTSVNSSYISAPRWYQNHKISFKAKSGYTLSGATIVCTSNDYATALKTSTYSTGASASVSSSTVTITCSGDFDITMGAQSRISSVTVTYTTSGGGTTPTNYTITVADNIANGTVTATPTSAAAGATVTLTATPASGYEFGSWNVTDASSKAVSVTNNQFVMPASDVNVSATFMPAFKGTITTMSAANNADIKFVTGSSSNDAAVWANSTPLTANSITLSGSVTSGTNYSYYDGSVVRFYTNNNIVITPSDGITIQKIEIVRQSTAGSNGGTIKCSSLIASNENTTTNTNVFTGSATSAVTFTVSAQVRFTSIVVYSTSGSTHAITLNTNGGTINAGNVTEYEEGTEVTLPTDVTKVGYDFSGWYDNADLTGDAVTTIGTEATGAKAFWAKWTAVSYDIIYNNVEDATHSNPTSYTIESADINLSAASKEGYIFAGWFSNEELTGTSVTTIAQGSTGNKTLWAKWTEIPANPCTVTFNVGEHGTCDTPYATEETVGSGVTLPSVTANEGWVFKGWSTANPATAETLVSADAEGIYHIMTDIQLYAFYKVKPATPTFSQSAGAIEKGDEITITCTTEGATIYYTTNGDEPTASSIAYTEAIAINEATTIKAIAILDDEQSEITSVEYVIATHTAQFFINEVVSNVNTKTVAKGEAINFPADPSDIGGKKFVGWVTSPIDGFMQDKPELISQANMGTSDVNYYAVFAIVSRRPSSLIKQGSSSSFESGDNIVIVATGTDWAKMMYQEIISKTYLDYKDFDGEIATIESDDKRYFTLSAETEGKWKLGDAKNGYVYNSNQNDLTVDKDNYSEWSISWVENKSKFSIKNGSRWLSCRNDLTKDNQYKFRGGGTSPTYGTIYFDIYKYVLGDYVYSDYCTTVNFFSATIAECGYTSVCLPYNAKIVEDGAQAYALSKITDDGALKFTAVDVMNANEGYVIKGTVGVNYTLTATAETNSEENILQGVTVQTEVSSLGFTRENSFAYPWILAKDGSFKKYTGVNIPANKAYLDGAYVEEYVSKSGASSASLRVVFEETEQTGLETMTEIGKGENFVYDLTGKKVQAVSKSGLYIVNGKKVVIK